MKIHYDRATDSMYIHLSGKESVESEEIADDFVVDFDADGAPSGLDIQHASKKFNITELVAKNMPVAKIAVA
ncbi:MAG: DUF2283 domain-containing protein [Gammaproteobacteria bacterium]|nr:DUF2283 domain-containing protein [Gammaproteobacteria bacterium]CAJ2375753.1 MAG: conserved hypothetical protein [Arenicellales bacterium IbO2]MDA7962010.1 DUF2283 domain-containing protein [Gammaproteobacteria bacterium]MDA7968533.1 DUF2283 domain-containing protein [Gammaproteobacteria bacterium]MDA7970444.1 DUF2283 domain-containing protein [Gammaproteobacteria bacterium]